MAVKNERKAAGATGRGRECGAPRVRRSQGGGAAARRLRDVAAQAAACEK